MTTHIALKMLTRERGKRQNNTHTDSKLSLIKGIFAAYETSLSRKKIFVRKKKKINCRLKKLEYVRDCLKERAREVETFTQLIRERERERERESKVLRRLIAYDSYPFIHHVKLKIINIIS